MKKKYLIIPLLLGLSLVSISIILKSNSNNEATYALTASSKLEKYRVAGIENLSELNLEEYREEQQNEFNNLKNSTINNINSSEDYNEIASIVSSFNRYILSIPTDAELTKEEEDASIVDSDVYYISSLDDLIEFRDDVNDGYSYKGDTVELTNDIVIPSGFNFGECIGNTDAKAFAGTFDGKGHTITGLTLSGKDSVALFSRVTGGLVKNLKMANVSVSVTGIQRGAAVVARLNNATVDNVEVLSGTINGTTQTGGIVGFMMENAIIKNCKNAATVTGTTTLTGGIVGTSHTDETSKTIFNCLNTGAVTSSSDFIGGIFGGTLAKAKQTVVISNCENQGNISGRNYVGGIIGIARESNQEISLISDCINKGNVSASGSTGIGGISGFSRINLTNCSCLSSATIKGNAASSLPAVGCVVEGSGGPTSGKYGYISGGTGLGAIQSGGKLID